ncbi:MAG: hypothetical protein ABL995_01390 [Bryobacteraceae bacterium]
MENKKISPRRFILQGFSQEEGARRFVYEGIEEDHARTLFTVHADLSLLRTYGIPMQELPLLCQELLERRADADPTHRLVFTEDDMRLYKEARVLAASIAQRKRLARRPPTDNTGAGWRKAPPLTPQPAI